MNKIMHKVFVYGTLMYGQPNHYLLNGSEFIGHATSLERYHVMSMGAFPAAVIDPVHNNWKIEGEMYSCAQETFERLDRLESNGWLYLRRMRPFKVLVDKKDVITQHAWIYELYHESRTDKTPSVCDDFVVYDDQVTKWQQKNTDWW
jgi:gamma-glutamylcyclotransferase (GGCT)/AIG2-like uncharacterized protein YtfP